MSILPFSSQNGNCNGKIITDQGWNITIQGSCNVQGATEVKYAAAAPADLRMSYMGSGLPYANEEVAYEGSPNIGRVAIQSGQFQFKLVSPNAYYKNNGSTLVQPHVHFTINNEYFDVPLPSAKKFENRSLTSMPGRPNRVSGR
jgi:hypothetical protein